MMSAGLLAGCVGTTDEVAVTGAAIGFGGSNLAGGCASTGLDAALIAADCIDGVLPTASGSLG